MKILRFYILLFLAASFTANCRSSGSTIKEPRAGMPTTEFHRKPAKWIPWFYANKSSRGIDRAGDVSFFNQVGAGLGVLVNSKLDDQWDGHKFFYYYLDLDFSPQYTPVGPYPGTKEWTISSYPGVLFRTYLPFYLKMHFGFGVNLRYNQLFYDRWGLYGSMGVELFGLTSTVVFIGHPGQPNWETEYRMGYMWVPVEWK
ncbi:MAG TPA: hypothetical protein PLY93_00930 [Turneriella sp.]|nr:hypothetical protein [Turneriella sp.]